MMMMMMMMKLKNIQYKVFIDKRSFFGSRCIPFQAPAVVNENVYAPPVLVVLFHNANVLV